MEIISRKLVFFYTIQEVIFNTLLRNSAGILGDNEVKWMSWASSNPSIKKKDNKIFV